MFLKDRNKIKKNLHRQVQIKKLFSKHILGIKNHDCHSDLQNHLIS